MVTGFFVVLYLVAGIIGVQILGMCIHDAFHSQGKEYQRLPEEVASDYPHPFVVLIFWPLFLCYFVVKFLFLTMYYSLKYFGTFIFGSAKKEDKELEIYDQIPT